MVVESDLRLPIAESDSVEARKPAWLIKRAAASAPRLPADAQQVAELRCEHGSTVTTRYRASNGAWIWNRSIGLFHVSPDARRVYVHSEPGADEHLLGLLLIGQIGVFVSHAWGRPCLHASAVVTQRGAIGFLGPQGRGKSTMAAAFLKRGATLLTDDALPLYQTDRGVLGGPGVPLMKLFNDTATSTLRIADELPNVVGTFPKKLLALDKRYPFAADPAPLRALYVLDRYDPVARGESTVSARPMSGRETLQTLLAQTSHRELLEPVEAARDLLFYTRLAAHVPVRQLAYPAGADYQDLVWDRVNADLESL